MLFRVFDPGIPTHRDPEDFLLSLNGAFTLFPSEFERFYQRYNRIEPLIVPTIWRLQ